MGDVPQLHDIHLPGPASFWPPALGWWLLLALLFFFLIWLLLTLRKRNRMKKRKAIVIKKLRALEAKLQESPSNEVLSELNTLLRQLAINTFPRENIASLTGADWLRFLDESGKTNGFTKGAGRILIEAPYQADNLHNFNLDEFIPLIRRWVKKIMKKWGGVT